MTAADPGILATLLSPRLWLALLLYGLLIMALELLHHRLQKAVHDVPLSAWLLEHLGLPWGRALLLIIFVITAYPALFGLASAPPLGELLAAGNGRLSTLINTAVVISLLLPLAPLVGVITGLVLPLQGIAIATLLFHWLAQATAADISYWPGWGTLLAVVASAALAQPLAQGAAHWLGQHLNRLSDREGFEHLTYEGLILLFQVPAILIYTLTLGRRLALGQ